MFVIRNENGELLHKSAKPFIDSRAVEVSSADEPVKQGIVWVTKNDAGEIFDICDDYPLNPNAQPVAKEDLELVAYWRAIAERGAMSSSARG